MLNPLVSDRVARLAEKWTAGIDPKHVTEMRSAAYRGLAPLLDQNPQWRQASIGDVRRGKHLVEVLLGPAAAKDKLARLSPEAKLNLGYIPVRFTPAYYAYMRCLWICYFLVLRAQHSDPEVSQEQVDLLSDAA